MRLKNSLRISGDVARSDVFGPSVVDELLACSWGVGKILPSLGALEAGSRAVATPDVFRNSVVDELLGFTSGVEKILPPTLEENLVDELLGFSGIGAENNQALAGAAGAFDRPDVFGALVVDEFLIFNVLNLGTSLCVCFTWALSCKTSCEKFVSGIASIALDLLCVVAVVELIKTN